MVLNYAEVWGYMLTHGQPAGGAIAEVGAG